MKHAIEYAVSFAGTTISHYLPIECLYAKMLNTYVYHRAGW